MFRPFLSLRPLLRLAGFSAAHNGVLPPSSAVAAAAFTTSTATNLKQLPPRPKHPPESEIEESFLKGSGPGGQKINKTNSAVQLKHLPTGIVVKSQATRSRTQNRKIARDLLALRLDELANGSQSRAAVVGDVKQKRAASKAKKSRRKYKKLAEEKEKKGNVKEEGGRLAGEEEEWLEEEEDGEEEEGKDEGGRKEVTTLGGTGTKRATIVEVENTRNER
ncbi:hypothetical protein NEMBOFW57_005970 [Staphylotrichum longicolle]|uniref:Prokaryotic-type class I peptide chain release factors domain-containing protein n=1 Tax=Staphylotrichum longicolle TaxID=669026 RepID=A0AAD4EYI4_9PEZI|nr:hypothetical protein NEMBOFW57_005970 [Staphylotrichum longicolle]